MQITTFVEYDITNAFAEQSIKLSRKNFIHRKLIYQSRLWRNKIKRFDYEPTVKMGS